MRSRRILLALGSTAVALAATPTLASAAVGATVTGDDGNPVAITPGLTIRNMDVKAGIAPTADTAQYAVTVVGPDGVAASSPQCISAKYPYSRSVDYRGNGAYTLTATPFGSDDYNCAKGATGAASTFQWAVASTMSIGPVANNGVALIRKPNSTTTIPVTIPAALSPGTTSTDIHYALGGAIGPDGAISGPSETTYIDRTTGLISLSLSRPGTYVLTGRQQGFATASGAFFTPWTPPVTIRAYVPFDLTSVSFPDSIGPSYLVKGYIREPSATGRVSLAGQREDLDEVDVLQALPRLDGQLPPARHLQGQRDDDGREDRPEVPRQPPLRRLAQTTAAAGARLERSLAAFSSRARRSTTARIVAGMNATTTRINDHQYALAKAWATPLTPSLRWSAIPFSRITVSIATPSDPPTRCSTLSIGVARGTCSLRRVAYVPAIAGIITAPSPRPRRNSPKQSQK